MPFPPLHNEKSILQRTAAGNESAFTLLFHHYRGRVDSIAYTITHSEAMAEELLQEIFLSIWVNRKELSSVKDFQSYLFIIIRNRAYTFLRRQASLRKLHLAATAGVGLTDDDTDRHIMDRDLGQLLERFIDRLPPQQQQVYRLSREQGLNREEIAERLHLSPNTVKSHMSQALKSIRSFCGAHLEPFIILLFLSGCFPSGCFLSGCGW